MVITRRFEIDVGHRLMQHEGKCKNYHGHRLGVLVTVSGGVNMLTGMLIDFADVKEACGKWLDTWWDHGMILERGDPMIPFLAQGDFKHFVMDRPPSVENLAREAHHNFNLLFRNREVSVSKVTIFETPNCFAEYP